MTRPVSRFHVASIACHERVDGASRHPLPRHAQQLIDGAIPRKGEFLLLKVALEGRGEVGGEVRGGQER
jgi:hypothetical protein